MQPVVREPSNVRSLKTRLAVEMLPALATIRVWFLTQVGDEEFDIRTSGRAMLKRLDGFEASLKLLIETLDDVRRARQARTMMMSHQTCPMPLKKGNGVPLLQTIIPPCMAQCLEEFLCRVFALGKENRVDSRAECFSSSELLGEGTGTLIACHERVVLSLLPEPCARPFQTRTNCLTII